MSNALCVDDDVLTAVRDRAPRKRVTLSKAVSRCVRNGFRESPQSASAPLAMRSKYSMLTAEGGIITSEQVRWLVRPLGIGGTTNGRFVRSFTCRPKQHLLKVMHYRTQGAVNIAVVGLIRPTRS